MLLEIHRVITPGGVFIQTHIGDSIGAMPDARWQLKLLAWVGFYDIRLIGDNPIRINALSFIATKGDKQYLLKDVLQSDFDEIYHQSSGYRAD